MQIREAQISRAKRGGTRRFADSLPTEAVVSVVVGTYNRLDQLRQCLSSIFQETQTPLHVYVTDAGSTDGTIPFLQKLQATDPRVVPFFTGQKIGQAKALNQIFPLVRTEFVCWLSDDNVVVNGGLDKAVAILRSHPRLGMVGLKVKDVEGPFIEAPYIGGICRFGLLNVNQGLLRTRILHDLGGFAEDLRDYGIDPDLTARVFLAGWDIAYTRQVAIHHFRKWETAPGSLQAQSRHERLKQAQFRYTDKFPKLAWFRQRALARKQLVFFCVRWLLQKIIGDISQKSLMGLPFRDWYNICHCRYISFWDGLRYWNQRFHLVQHSTTSERSAWREAGSR